MILVALGSIPAIVGAQEAVDEERPPGMGPLDPELYFQEAPDVEGPLMPPRLLLSLGGGTSLRLVQDLDFDQDRFGPGYLDLFGSYVFATTSTLRHALGLGLSLNVSGDGGELIGVDPAQQVVVAPAYLAYLRFGQDLVLTGKVSIPLTLTPNASPGIEAALGAVYLVTAGLGPYVELGGSVFLGSDSSTHPLVTAEAGIFIDYEVLP